MVYLLSYSGTYKQYDRRQVAQYISLQGAGFVGEIEACIINNIM